MKTTLSLILVLCTILVLSSCVKKLDPKENPFPENNTSNLAGLYVTSNFDWKTSTVVPVSIQTLDNTGAAIPNIKVSLYSDYEALGGKKIISGFTNSNGLLELDYVFASATDSLVVGTDYIGFVKEIKVPISEGRLDYIFGGKPLNREIVGAVYSFKSSKDFDDIELNFLGSWNTYGVPNYLVSPGDNITSDFLVDINSILTEGQSASANHPEYFANNLNQSIYLLETADIWITFVSEGSGDRNTLAYYTFDKNNPPEEEGDITECTIIFPNASFNGSKGGLYSGDKVHLGQFPAGTSIGWLLIIDAFNDKDNDVEEGDEYLFSHKVLNELSDSPYQQHVVMIEDLTRERFIISFEEKERPKKDQDFNDNIFYATVSPSSAIGNDLYPNIGVADYDADDDGVDDSFDDYPDDADLAFNNYYPSQNNYASLAIEDLWPSKGDYDFNDLVIDYNFNTITNADNKVVKLKGDFIVRAIGAGFHNGFGFELENILSAQVSSLAGSAFEEGYISLNANGTEAGQTNATVIVFDDAWNHGFGNTNPTKTYIEPTEIIQIELVLNTPVSLDQFGLAPFNPFIIVNKERGREIHMANYSPTDLADLSYFGQYNDDSSIATGKYYKTIDNLPWILNFPQKFDYPIEKTSIDKAYLNFAQWVESGGTLFKDWYINKVDYRNSDFIY